MSPSIPEIVTDPRAALATYIRELEEHYYPWYDSAASRNYFLWSIAQAIALLSGFATALIAALLRDDQFQTWAFGRTLLIVIPLVGSLASVFLVQSRIVELEALRERGRQEIQRLAAEARANYASATTPEKLLEIHQALISAVAALELEQARGWQSLIPKQVSFKRQGG
jgi:hypothetical protein